MAPSIRAAPNTTDGSPARSGIARWLAGLPPLRGCFASDEGERLDARACETCLQDAHSALSADAAAMAAEQAAEKKVAVLAEKDEALAAAAAKSEARIASLQVSY